MRKFLENAPIGRKLWLLVAVASLGIAGLAASDLLNERHAMFVEKELATKHVVETATSVVARYYAQAQSGTMTEDAAKAAALATLRDLRYEGKEYFWVQDMHPTMLMHPIKPELNGKDLGPVADSSGQHFFQSMVDVVKAQGAGYVHYEFAKPGQKGAFPKISYVQGFAPWGWIVGSGIYVDDVNEQFIHNAIGSGLELLALMTAMGLLSAWLVRHITRPIGAAVTAAEAIADGRIDVHIPSGGRDETGRLLASMQAMQQSLQRFVEAQGHMARAHAAGEVDASMPAAGFKGTFGAMAGSINTLVAGHIGVQHQLLEVMEHYARGDFRPDMPALPGRQAAITEAVALVKANLQAINQDILALSSAAMSGDFSRRGQAERYEFTFRTMVENLNRLMETCHASLGDVSRMLALLAKGDLTAQVDNDYEGMFGALRDDANSTVLQLRALVGRILQAIEEINVAAGEIAQGNSDLSGRTEQQAASLEETSSSMEELMSTVMQNSENAKHANDLTRSAAQVAERGGMAVTQVVQTMDAISASSKRIADIIGVIDGIAFQTNILALNAAVEAARAGDQGRGFAVVAGEVRSLAQRSAAAANEIKAIISDSVREVDTGSSRVREAGSTMQDTVQSVRRITDIMGDIVSASAEQSSGISQVNQAVSDMDRTTQQNAALVEEAAAAAQSLKEQALQLRQAVSVFRLPGAARPALRPVTLKVA